MAGVGACWSRPAYLARDSQHALLAHNWLQPLRYCCCCCRGQDHNLPTLCGHGCAVSACKRPPALSARAWRAAYQGLAGLSRRATIVVGSISTWHNPPKPPTRAPTQPAGAHVWVHTPDERMAEAWAALGGVGHSGVHSGSGS